MCIDKIKEIDMDKKLLYIYIKNDGCERRMIQWTWGVVRGNQIAHACVKFMKRGLPTQIIKASMGMLGH